MADQLANVQAPGPNDQHDQRVAVRDANHNAPPPAPVRNILSRAADKLISSYLIGEYRSNPSLHRRYATINSQNLFNRLVAIYTKQFTIHHRVFKPVLDAFEFPTGSNKYKHAAAAYVSAWFFDTYVSIQESVRKLSGSAFLQHFSANLSFIHEKYDPLLQHLNAVIRPTKLLAIEDALYIPMFAASYNFNVDNPFALSGWNLNDEQSGSLLEVMSNRNNEWIITPLNHDVFGRPMWLLDWHQGSAYAWFTAEGHYSPSDLVAAYIIGEACTPNMGPSDRDEWQTWPNNSKPATISIGSLKRVETRTIAYGATARTVQTRKIKFPDYYYAGGPSGQLRRKKKKQAATSSKALTQATSEVESQSSPAGDQSQETEVTESIELEQYRIIDWCYETKVIFEVRAQDQNAAIKSILFNE
nr:coat protein [Carrot cryptic virus 2]